MAQENQQVMMNSLKRKLSPNVQGNDFQKKALTTSSGTASPSSSAFSLIEMFLNKEQSKGDLKIHNQHFTLQWWQREPLLLQYLELVWQIMLIRQDGNRLLPFLQDIEALGLDILGLQERPESIYTTIVTSALQVSKNHENHADDKSGLVKVDPKPKKGIISALIDFTVKALVKFLYPNLEPSAFLEGDFGPIREETTPTSDLKVEGEIPKSLNGMMIRNGPNPPFDPVAKYSWLDGDSMLHAIRFKEGKATYVSRYVQTSRFKQEQFFEEAEFLKYGDLDGAFGLLMSCVQLLRCKLGVLDVSYGWLNGDTGLVYHDGMLMALQDFDKPYVVNVSSNGDLKTSGINDYRKRLTHSFLPHPKKDPVTGEMFMLGVSYTPPYAIYNHVTKDGLMSDPVPLTTSGPTYMHDMGITKNYVIFMDLPYCYDPENMVNNDDWIYMLDTCKKSRFGVLPRYATSENKIQWFEFDNSFFIYHNGNSWEENDGTIVLISCLMEPEPSAHGSTSQINTRVLSHSIGSIMSHEVPKKTKLFFSPAHVYNGPRRRRNFNPAHVYNGPSHQGNQESNGDTEINEHMNISLPTLYKFEFNLKTGKATKKQLSQTYCDFPKINEGYMGRKSQYVYTSEANHDPKLISIVKNDLQWETELKLEFGQSIYGSEVVFVPRQVNMSSAEDDGYLTTFVHNEKTKLSYAYVINAQKMELTAMVELPSRVPYGFHAVFVAEEELHAQKNIELLG